MNQSIKVNEPILNRVTIDGEQFQQISDVNAMRTFFMSIVSDANHWMFIGSNGGLSAGRKDSENALFPYYTDDKIIESVENTGSKSIFQVKKDDKTHIWEPFSERFSCLYSITRNLYKNIYGNKVMFEEINHDLKLTFRYQWNSSNKFGFIKKGTLINGNEAPTDISFIDGIQNILPYYVGSQLQNQRSNLVDAYKRNELKENVGLGIFALSAVIVDKAEPSEALKANIAWSMGIDNPQYLVSSLQLEHFRRGQKPVQENDVKAEKGAYFVYTDVTLAAGEETNWSIVTDVNQNHASIASLSQKILNNKDLLTEISEDIDLGTRNLISLNAGSDGLQLTADKLRDTRHFANSLFNIMRGGIFDNNYTIEKVDFAEYLSKLNKNVLTSVKSQLNTLPDAFSVSKLKEIVFQNKNIDFQRLSLEYLPLKFSRRHGDPSRPWNNFSINTQNEHDGSKVLDYEGNWRDIFQNWEALAHSYPEFTDGMIFKFLNASTFDGYNPYRVTKNGIDWETIEPDDPWSYIGYWGDHQIIYLLKFLEFAERHNPGQLDSYIEHDMFVYANVPYKIKPYSDILKNPKDTIDFDDDLDHKIKKGWKDLGADSVLHTDVNGNIHHVNFIEKILATALAKMSNFIPEGGIWMNTQRPEWNDANNALVGNGVSMVTLYYLRRFLTFFDSIFEKTSKTELQISEELKSFFESILLTLTSNEHKLQASLSDEDRRTILDRLGRAGSQYREKIYKHHFSGNKTSISIDELRVFTRVSNLFLEHSIRQNKRADNLFHAYNLMTVSGDDKIKISYLSEMLEGQVGVLSSGYLPSDDALNVLDALKSSKLFRPDQYSYLLYPNKDLPGFTEKNTIPKEAIANSTLFSALVENGNHQIIIKDVDGEFHFNDNFKNANDLSNALKSLNEKYHPLVKSETDDALAVFEEVFNHKAFTGRSGTFFGYEGLGSIYWHMVSKLQLAVQECCLKAIDEKASEATVGRLLEHYYEINQSIGIHKSPALYGAFPTDPYSHTPAGKGAQQPGMTGQVKEDILCRFGELGIFVENGSLKFNPCLLRKNEFLTEKETIDFVDISSSILSIDLEANSLCFSYCQIPMIYQLKDKKSTEVFFNDGTQIVNESLILDRETSNKIFRRTGDISKIIVSIIASDLR